MDGNGSDRRIPRKKKAKRGQPKGNAAHPTVQDADNKTDSKVQDEPKRPLSAYNFFFREKRAELLQLSMEEYDPSLKEKRMHRKTHGIMPFITMAKTIASMWKGLASEERYKYQDLAASDNIRYFNAKENISKRQKAKIRNPPINLPIEAVTSTNIETFSRNISSNDGCQLNTESSDEAVKSPNYEDNQKSHNLSITPCTANLSTQESSSISLQHILDDRDCQWMAYLRQQQLNRDILEQPNHFSLLNQPPQDNTIHTLHGMGPIFDPRVKLFLEYQQRINNPLLYHGQLVGDMGGRMATSQYDWIAQPSTLIPRQQPIFSQVMYPSGIHMPLDEAFTALPARIGTHSHSMVYSSGLIFPSRQHLLSRLNVSMPIPHHHQHPQHFSSSNLQTRQKSSLENPFNIANNRYVDLNTRIPQRQSHIPQSIIPPGSSFPVEDNLASSATIHSSLLPVPNETKSS